MLLETYLQGVRENGLNTNKARNIVAEAGAYNFDYSLSTGTFKTPSGAFTQGGDFNMAAGKQVFLDDGAVTLSSNAGTSNKQAVKITTEDLTTGTGSTVTLTLTNSLIAATSIVLVTVGNGTNSAGQPTVLSVTPGAGSVAIIIKNSSGATAFNGTLVLSVLVLN